MELSSDLVATLTIESINFSFVICINNSKINILALVISGCSLCTVKCLSILVGVS